MEFLALLLVTFAIAIAVSVLVVRFFKNPIDSILTRIIGEEIASAWRKFLTFALLVVGVSSGVNIYRLERFVAPERNDMPQPALSPEYWGLEAYRTVIHTLGGMAWALLIFFVVALIAFVIVKRGEMRSKV